MSRYHEKPNIRTNVKDYLLHYADDTTFTYHQRSTEKVHEKAQRPAGCDCAMCATQNTNETLPAVMCEYDMQMNESKTKYTTLQVDVATKLKFLGTNIDTSTEVKSRVNNGAKALIKMQNIFKQEKISDKAI